MLLRLTHGMAQPNKMLLPTFSCIGATSLAYNGGMDGRRKRQTAPLEVGKARSFGNKFDPK